MVYYNCYQLVYTLNKELLYGVYTSNIVVFTQENKNLLHIHSEL